MTYPVLVELPAVFVFQSSDLASLLLPKMTEGFIRRLYVIYRQTMKVYIDAIVQQYTTNQQFVLQKAIHIYTFTVCTDISATYNVALPSILEIVLSTVVLLLKQTCRFEDEHILIEAKIKDNPTSVTD